MNGKRDQRGALLMLVVVRVAFHMFVVRLVCPRCKGECCECSLLFALFLYSILCYGGVDGMSMDLGSVGAPFCHI